MIPTFDALKGEYAQLWQTVEIRSSKAADIVATAEKIIGAKTGRYANVERQTGVPWFVVGIIHMMEAGGRFDRHLHNGDPLTARTFQVPAGRPAEGDPPFGWIESACDALLMKGLDKIQEWSIERICFELERYNGWGYRRFHAETLSPYLWSGTNHYSRGKYVADGVWSASAVSGQSGALALLKQLIEIDRDVAAAIRPVAAVDPAVEFPKAHLAEAANINPADLQSRTIRDATAMQRVGQATTVGTVVGTIAKAAQDANVPAAPPAVDLVALKQAADGVGIVQKLMEGGASITKFAVANWWIFLVVVGLLLWWYGRRIVNWYLEDIRTGKRTPVFKVTAKLAGRAAP